MRTTPSHFMQAKKEGRICTHCGWMITKKMWAKGSTLCSGCTYALQGVRTNSGASPVSDEPIEKTGES